MSYIPTPMYSVRAPQQIIAEQPIGALPLAVYQNQAPVLYQPQQRNPFSSYGDLVERKDLLRRSSLNLSSERVRYDEMKRLLKRNEVSDAFQNLEAQKERERQIKQVQELQALQVETAPKKGRKQQKQQNGAVPQPQYAQYGVVQPQYGAVPPPVFAQQYFY